MAMNLDAATRAALKQQEAERAHKRRLGETRSRGYQQRKTLAEKSARKQEEYQAREQAKSSGEVARLKLRSQQKAQDRAAREQEKRALQPGREEIAGRAIGTGIAGTGNFIGGHDLLSTTLWLMFGLIIVYLLVTNSGQFAGFTSTLGNFLSKLTTTQPLFQVAQSQSS